MHVLRRISTLLLFIFPLAANAQGYHYDRIPGGIGGGPVSGDIHLEGNKLTTDADRDTGFQSLSDDTLATTFGGIGIIIQNIAGSTFGHNLTIGAANTFRFSGNSGVRSGAGPPEGSISMTVGSLWLRTDGTYGIEAYLKTVGSGSTGWSKIATIPIDGTGLVWDEDYQGASEGKVPSSGVPDWDAFPSGGANDTYCYPDGSDTNLDFNGLSMGHTYAAGTDVQLHLHWAPDGTNTGDVDWEISYTTCTDGSACTSPTVVSVQQAGGGTADEIQTVLLATITGTGFDEGTLINVDVKRDGDDGTNDTLTDKACLLAVGVHYQVDDLGTRGASPH